MLVGRPEDALAHLRRALDLQPEWSRLASEDNDFAALRKRPDWPASLA